MLQLRGLRSITLIIGLILFCFYGCRSPQEDSLKDRQEMSLAIDQWIGWRSILKANGGLETKPGSIYDKLGLDLTIKIMDDNSFKLDAFIAGDVDAIGSTVNRYAFEMTRLKSAGISPKMFIITNSSTGGDGIIATSEIRRIEDLLHRRVAVARFTEAHCLLEFCLLKSSLSEKERDIVRKDIIYTSDAGEAGSIFFSGKADAAATWQPFLAQATETKGSHILIDTRTLPHFILDGIITRSENIERRRESLELFARGVFEASDLLRTEEAEESADLQYLRLSFPICANMSNQELRRMLPDAALFSLQESAKALEQNGPAERAFQQSSEIWKELGERVVLGSASEGFSSQIIVP